MAGGISIHGVDVARGVPASGLLVGVERLGPARLAVAAGRLGANGLLDHPIARGEGVEAGAYEVQFHIAEYLRASGYPAEQVGFLDVLPFRFVVTKVDEHYHLPLKFTPWGIMLFRGS